MLVILGGFVGSGRNAFARGLEKRHGFYFYDMDQHGLDANFFNTSRQFVTQRIRPDSDAGRLHIYRKTIESFHLVSKMHENVVVTATFHRAVPRNYFFSEAKRYFDPVIFVWIDCEEKKAQERLKRMRRRNVIPSVDRSVRNRAKAQEEFEPFDVPPPTFFFSGKTAENTDALYEFIQREAGGKGQGV